MLQCGQKLGSSDPGCGERVQVAKAPCMTAGVYPRRGSLPQVVHGAFGIRGRE